MATTLKNLLTSALYADGKVQTGNWSAHRNLYRPQCILVYHGTKVIMEVDLQAKTLNSLTYKVPKAKEMESITKILAGGGVSEKFTPAQKGISV